MSSISCSPSPRLSFARYRDASIRTTQLAGYWRASFRPTHHAKRRAVHLNLRVDTAKAVKLDQRHVSNIPLPIIVADPSPSHAPVAFRSLPIIPADAQEEEGEYEDSDEDLSSDEDEDEECEFELEEMDFLCAGDQIEAPSNKPFLQCIIPMDIAVPGLEASKFSANTETFLYPTISLASASPFADAVMASPAAQGSRRDISLAPLAVPEVIGRLNWDEAEALNASPVSTHSESSSASSSGGPLTPEDPAGITLRTKRKSANLDLDEDVHQLFEKRPKFERKEWVNESRERPVISLRNLPCL